jgi:hypothetical protein
MRNRREDVIDIRAFSKSRINNNNPLSVKVRENQGIFKENKGIPGSFHINKITNDSTNKTGKKHQLINFLIGRLDFQYIRSINAYITTSSSTLCEMVKITMMAISPNSFVQGLILVRKEQQFSL